MSRMNVRMMKMIFEGVVNECASMYGFDANEALERMGAKMMEKKKCGKESKTRVIPLPFDGIIREDCCKAIKMNHGLYTQCNNKSEKICSSCSSEAAKNDDQLPYGNIEERIAAGSEFKDSKGRKPTPYAKVLKKLKLSKEEVLSYAAEQGVELDESQLEMQVAEKKIAADEEKRGRPKKSGKTIEVDNSEDLFAGLVQNSLSENVILENDSKEAEKLAKAEKLAAEKEAKKAALEAEKLAKAEKLAAEKAEKEAKKAALEAEKLAKAEKLTAEKAEKEAKKAALEAEKLAKAEKLAAEKAEKEAKKAEKETEKLAKKAALEAKKGEKKEKKPASTGAAKTEVKDTDDEEEEISVNKFEINGKIYLISNKNVLYDAENQDEIGVWNEGKQEIEFSMELEEEEEEE